MRVDQLPELRCATADRRRWSARRGSAGPDRGSARSQPELLLHAARELAGRTVEKRPEPVERSGIQMRRGARRRHAEQAAKNCRFSDRQVLEVFAQAPRHVGDAGRPRCGGCVRDVAAEHPHRPSWIVRVRRPPATAGWTCRRRPGRSGRPCSRPHRLAIPPSARTLTIVQANAAMIGDDRRAAVLGFSVRWNGPTRGRPARDRPVKLVATGRW